MAISIMLNVFSSKACNGNAVLVSRHVSYPYLKAAATCLGTINNMSKCMYSFNT